MGLVKRSAKRIAPKTLNKMKEARAEKEQEQKENKWLKTKENRIKQIEEQRNHLLNQKLKPDNPFHGSVLVEYKTKANTEATLKARGGKISEGTIISERKYGELLKRNKKVLVKSKKEYESDNLYLKFLRQKNAISKTSLSTFEEYREKVVDYILKKYNKGKIDYATTLDLANKMDFCVKTAINQSRELIRQFPEHKEMHSRVVGKILVDFLKKRDYPEMNRTLNTITLAIKERSGVFKTLQELDQFYKK